MYKKVKWAGAVCYYKKDKGECAGGATKSIQNYRVTSLHRMHENKASTPVIVPRLCKAIFMKTDTQLVLLTQRKFTVSLVKKVVKHWLSYTSASVSHTLHIHPFLSSRSWSDHDLKKRKKSNFSISVHLSEPATLCHFSIFHLLLIQRINDTIFFPACASVIGTLTSSCSLQQDVPSLIGQLVTEVC